MLSSHTGTSDNPIHLQGQWFLFHLDSIGMLSVIDSSYQSVQLVNFEVLFLPLDACHLSSHMIG
jgi:hypothetical protein